MKNVKESDDIASEKLNYSLSLYETNISFAY